MWRSLIYTITFKKQNKSDRVNHFVFVNNVDQLETAISQLEKIKRLSARKAFLLKRFAL
jgi:predicted GIY-YIG superfamily endonuclease